MTRDWPEFEFDGSNVGAYGTIPGRRGADNLAGWLNSGKTPAEEAIARRDAEDRARYGDRVDDPNPYTEDERQPLVDARYLELHEQLLDLDGLRNLEPPSPLVEGYLFHDSLAWLGGKPGHAKSFLAVDLACSVGTGTSWHGREVTQGVVLYLIAEGAAGIAQRVDAWVLANGTPVKNVLFLPVPVQLMNRVDVSAFAQLVMNIDADLAIIDTQARVTVGAEENSSKDMGRFVDYLEQIRRHTSTCVLVVHHEPRNGENLRGSTALEGAATTILRVSKDGNVVELTNPKQKDTPEQAPMLLGLRQVGESAVLSHDTAGLGGFMTESETLVMGLLWEMSGDLGIRKTELREMSKLPKSTWYRTINALIKKGKVTEQKQGNSVFVVAVNPVSGQSQESHGTVGIVTTRSGVSQPDSQPFPPAQTALTSDFPTSPTESHSHPGNSPTVPHPVGVGLVGIPAETDPWGDTFDPNSQGAAAQEGTPQ